MTDTASQPTGRDGVKDAFAYLVVVLLLSPIIAIALGLAYRAFLWTAGA